MIRSCPPLLISAPASGQGKTTRPERVQAREGWEAIPAVRTGHVYEIKSAEILSPGPAALTDGLSQIRRIIRRWSEETEP